MNLTDIPGVRVRFAAQYDTLHAGSYPYCRHPDGCKCGGTKFEDCPIDDVLAESFTYYLTNPDTLTDEQEHDLSYANADSWGDESPTLVEAMRKAVAKYPAADIEFLPPRVPGPVGDLRTMFLMGIERECAALANTRGSREEDRLPEDKEELRDGLRRDGWEMAPWGASMLQVWRNEGPFLACALLQKELRGGWFLVGWQPAHDLWNWEPQVYKTWSGLLNRIAQEQARNRGYHGFNEEHHEQNQ